MTRPGGPGGGAGGGGALGQFGAGEGRKSAKRYEMAFESSVRDSDLPILFIYYKYLFLRGGLGRLAAVISSSFIMILTSTAALADAPMA